jgi:hypothetical protein
VSALTLDLGLLAGQVSVDTKACACKRCPSGTTSQGGFLVELSQCRAGINARAFAAYGAATPCGAYLTGVRAWYSAARSMIVGLETILSDGSSVMSGIAKGNASGEQACLLDTLEPWMLRGWTHNSKCFASTCRQHALINAVYLRAGLPSTICAHNPSTSLTHPLPTAAVSVPSGQKVTTLTVYQTGSRVEALRLATDAGVTLNLGKSAPSAPRAVIQAPLKTALGGISGALAYPGGPLISVTPLFNLVGRVTKAGTTNQCVECNTASDCSAAGFVSLSDAACDALSNTCGCAARYLLTGSGATRQCVFEGCPAGQVVQAGTADTCVVSSVTSQ